MARNQVCAARAGMQPRGLLDSATSSALGPASCARGSPTGHLNHHGMLLMERARPGIRVRSATQHHVCNPASDNQTHHLPLPADASALFKFPESSALGSASRPARGPASSPSAPIKRQKPAARSGIICLFNAADFHVMFSIDHSRPGGIIRTGPALARAASHH